MPLGAKENREGTRLNLASCLAKLTLSIGSEDSIFALMGLCDWPIIPCDARVRFECIEYPWPLKSMRSLSIPRLTPSALHSFSRGRKRGDLVI